MITIRTHSLAVLLVLIAGYAQAQTASAEDYFNRAAREYVKQDKGSALRTLNKGLKEHPGDARLLKLAEELLKEQDQQDQQQAQQQEQNKQDDKQDGGKDQQQDQGQQKEDQQAGREQERQEQRSEQQGQQTGRISPQDAQRMLDAMDRQEKDVQEKVRVKQRPVQRTPIDKDW
jgi:hypothetical protein